MEKDFPQLLFLPRLNLDLATRRPVRGRREPLLGVGGGRRGQAGFRTEDRKKGVGCGREGEEEEGRGARRLQSSAQLLLISYPNPDPHPHPYPTPHPCTLNP